MTKTRSTTTGPAAAPTARVQTRGPMGPSEPEITLHAGLSDGAFAATPPGHVVRSRPTTLLVTDDASTVARIPAKEALLVDGTGPRVAMRQALSRMRDLPVEDRTIAVAGSTALLAEAIDDSFRVVLVCEADEAPPHAVAHWRSSRAKGADSVVLTRD